MSRYLAIMLLALFGCMPMIGCDASVEEIGEATGEAAPPPNMDAAMADQMNRGGGGGEKMEE